jgi:hypothetical protein
MKKILTDAAAIGNAAARTLNFRWRPSDGGSYYPNSTWFNPLFLGGYNMETPPPQVSANGVITPYPPTGARTLNVRTVMFFGYTYITPAMIMRLTDIGSQYLIQAVDSNGEYFDGNKIYKVTLPPNVPAGNSGLSPSTTTRRARCSTRHSATRALAARAIRRPPPKPVPTAPPPCISARPGPTA